MVSAVEQSKAITRILKRKGRSSGIVSQSDISKEIAREEKKSSYIGEPITVVTSHGTVQVSRSELEQIKEGASLSISKPPQSETLYELEQEKGGSTKKVALVSEGIKNIISQQAPPTTAKVISQYKPPTATEYIKGGISSGRERARVSELQAKKEAERLSQDGLTIRELPYYISSRGRQFVSATMSDIGDLGVVGARIGSDIYAEAKSGRSYNVSDYIGTEQDKTKQIGFKDIKRLKNVTKESIGVAIVGAKEKISTALEVEERGKFGVASGFVGTALLTYGASRLVSKGVARVKFGVSDDVVANIETKTTRLPLYTRGGILDVTGASGFVKVGKKVFSVGGKLESVILSGKRIFSGETILNLGKKVSKISIVGTGELIGGFEEGIIRTGRIVKGKATIISDSFFRTQYSKELFRKTVGSSIKVVKKYEGYRVLSDIVEIGSRRVKGVISLVKPSFAETRAIGRKYGVQTILKPSFRSQTIFRATKGTKPFQLLTGKSIGTSFTAIKIPKTLGIGKTRSMALDLVRGVPKSISKRLGLEKGTITGQKITAINIARKSEIKAIQSGRDIFTITKDKTLTKTLLPPVDITALITQQAQAEFSIQKKAFSVNLAKSSTLKATSINKPLTLTGKTAQVTTTPIIRLKPTSRQVSSEVQSYGLRLKPNQKDKIIVAQRGKMGQRIGVFEGTAQSLNIKQAQTTKQAQSLKTLIKSRTTLKPRTLEAFHYTAIPPTLTVPGGFGFPAVFLRDLDKTKKLRSTFSINFNQQRKFTPTATATTFNIKGRRSKRGELTGLGLRPIPSLI